MPSLTSIEGELEIVLWPNYDFRYSIGVLHYRIDPLHMTQVLFTSHHSKSPKLYVLLSWSLGSLVFYTQCMQSKKKLKRVFMCTCVFYWLYISKYQTQCNDHCENVELLFIITHYWKIIIEIKIKTYKKVIKYSVKLH